MVEPSFLNVIIITFDLHEINSQFYSELLMWWTDFREKHVPELNGKNILWNNELIRIADRPIYYPKYV